MNYATLAKKGSEYDPECLRCHTVGYGAKDGFLNTNGRDVTIDVDIASGDYGLVKQGMGTLFLKGKLEGTITTAGGITEQEGKVVIMPSVSVDKSSY